MSRSFVRACAVGLVSLAAMSASYAVHAQPKDDKPPTEEEIKESDRLFAEGRRLMQDARKLNEACDVLTKSYALRKRGDTLLNLAECHRRQGKTATAWREFDEAIKYAKEVQFTEAIEAAERLRDKLALGLSELRIDVTMPEPVPPGMVVILDGKPLPQNQWNEPLYVDPGLHTVSAAADGYRSFDGTADVKEGAGRAVITVTLEKIPEPPKPQEPPKPEPPKPPPPAPKPPPPPPQETSLPVWAIVVGSAGVAMMGVSIGFGVDTLGAHSELDDECGGEERDACPSNYDFEGAHSREIRSFGIFVGFGAAGIAAVTVGAIGLGVGLSSPSSPTAGWLPIPWVSPEGGGLTLARALP